MHPWTRGGDPGGVRAEDAGPEDAWQVPRGTSDPQRVIESRCGSRLCGCLYPSQPRGGVSPAFQSDICEDRPPGHVGSPHFWSPLPPLTNG